MWKISCHLLYNWDWNTELLEGLLPIRRTRVGGQDRKDPKSTVSAHRCSRPGQLGLVIPALQNQDTLGTTGILS